jgi:hypothetical protein
MVASGRIDQSRKPPLLLLIERIGRLMPGTMPPRSRPKPKQSTHQYQWRQAPQNQGVLLKRWL